MATIITMLRLFLIAVVSFGCAGTDRSQDNPGSSDLVLKVEAATRDADPIVREDAAYLLGRRGPATSIECLGSLCEDPNEGVRRVAIQSIGNFRGQHGRLGPLAADYLLTAVRDSSWSIQRMAWAQLAICDDLTTSQSDSVRACLDDDSPELRIMALRVLGKAGADPVLESLAVELIEQHSDGPMDRFIALLLPSIHQPENLWAVERLLGSLDPRVRFQARCAMARIDGSNEQWKQQARLEEQYVQENLLARETLREAAWEAVPKSELLKQVAESRLVMFGELHASEGPIRVAQMEALRAFVKEPALEAVGFEPSVENSQRQVLDLAQSLGLRTIALESNWAELGSAGRNGARDLETASAIEAFLDENSAHRMFVVRGESHLLPDGYLARRLKHEPLILLSGIAPTVPLSVGGMRCLGSTYRLGPGHGTYVWTCFDEVSWGRGVPALERWLAEH